MILSDLRREFFRIAAPEVLVRDHSNQSKRKLLVGPETATYLIKSRMFADESDTCVPDAADRLAFRRFRAGG